MSGGTSPFTYSWSGPSGYSSIFEDIVGLVDGFYQVNILDYNNCLFNNIFNITNPSLLDTSSVIKNNISCNGGNNGSIILDVTGGTPSYNYSWSNGDTSYQTTNVSVGIYNVTICVASSLKSNNLSRIGLLSRKSYFPWISVGIAPGFS